MDLITPGLGIFFWQSVTFLFVLLVLKKFAWRRIVNLIEERENSVKGALGSAKEAKRQLDKLQEKSKEILNQTNLEAERILKEAIASKEEIILKSKKEAIKLGEELLEKARKSIAKEKDIALLEMKNDLSDIILNLTEKIIKERMENPEQQKRHIQNLINNLPKAS